MERKLNEDSGYLESVRLWIEAQQFLIDELNLKKDYIIKNIEILKNSLNNTNEAILHEGEQLLSYKNQHNV